MHLIRLVRPGSVDRLIAFKNLPEYLLRGIEKTSIEDSGLGRHWKGFFENQFILYYEFVNQDRAKWEDIVSYARLHLAPLKSMRDNVVQMALPVAIDCAQGVNIEPEGVPVIELMELAKSPEPIKTTQELVDVPKSEEKEISRPVMEKVPHAVSCKTRGLAGKYTDGCPRCEQLKTRRLVIA